MLRTACLFVLAAFGGGLTPAGAALYPERPVRFIVPFAPGGQLIFSIQ